MKKIISSPLVLAAFASSVFSIAPSGFAATYSKANNATALNSTASWATATIPTGTDIALWDNTVTAANTVALGANLTFGQIAITNPGGAVTISAGNTLTLNGVAGVGIDMSTAAQNLTIAAPVALGADQSWTVASGRTLTVTGVTSGAFALSKDGVGALVLSGANTYSGGTTVNAGTLTLGNNTGAGTGAITVGATGTLGLNSGINVANVISGGRNDQLDQQYAQWFVERLHGRAERPLQQLEWQNGHRFRCHPGREHDDVGGEWSDPLCQQWRDGSGCHFSDGHGQHGRIGSPPGGRHGLRRGHAAFGLHGRGE